MTDMAAKFEQMCDRFAELSEAMAQSQVIADQAQYRSVLKERAALEPAVSAWQKYLAQQKHLKEAEDMLQDAELADMAKEEITALKQAQEAMEQELRILLLPKDPDDDRNVVMEIRAGAGGEEACLFGADLLRMYTRYAERHGLKVEYISESPTELGGMKEAVFSVVGNGSFAKLKYESGVHRVQRIPVTDATGKRQTSTCTVAVLPEAEEVDVTIDPKDLRIDVYRSTGHGGQCVNTTDSAVRITHLPTGMVVTCQDEKSQIKNRDKALKVLRSRLLEKHREEAHSAYAADRRMQVGTGDRSERIRTYNFHEGRVTDHRIGLTLYRIDEIMDGDLDEIIDALRMEEQARLLEEMQ